jgi:hypothetical protein
MMVSGTHRDVFIPSAGLVDCDVKAPGVTPSESG